MRVRYSFSSRKTGNIAHIEKQRRKYPAIVDEIVKISDIILEVLDARFLTETRNMELEEAIKMQDKKIIYVLNKCDLVDMDSKKEELKALGLYPYVFVSSLKRVGVGNLREKIKIAAKKVHLPTEGMKRVQVGIIGYPNTGKSSMINVLTGHSSAGVGREAGFTKGIQKIKLSTDIVILDTPGVIPNAEYSHQKMEFISQHAKLNARDYSKVKNPEFVIGKIMEEYPEAFDRYYDFKAEGNPDALIQHIGQTKKLLVKGGEVDDDRTARLILRHWQEGKIKI
jgi:ribosome biogenesis GTPase A